MAPLSITDSAGTQVLRRSEGLIHMNSKVAVEIAVGVALVIVVGAVAVIVAGMGSNQTKDYVVYDGNGGKDSEGKTTVNSTMTEAMSNIFTNEGKVFIGWNTKADGTGTKIDVGENVTMGMTLYAQWSKYSLTIENIAYVLMGLSAYLTDDTHQMVKQSTFQIPLSEKGVAVISFATWDEVTVNTVTGEFTGKVGIFNTSLKFNITGADDIAYSVDTDGKVASISIAYSGNVVFG